MVITKKLLQEVLERVKPSKEVDREVLEKVNAFVTALNREVKKVDAKAVLGGSYAKDTWLAGDYDVDVFVLFKMKRKDDDLSELLEKALKKWKPERVHGSRDYFWVRDHVRYEIVPVLDIKTADDAMNVTDFSPWHVEWVKKQSAQFKDDIRLAKQFCKASGCYGAESYKRGLSGHVLDILTIHYKGFAKFIKEATKWKSKVVVDPEKVYKGRALMTLNKSKTEGPLVVIDPVQPDRNASAALSKEMFDKFVKAANAFVKKPSIKQFEPELFDVEKHKKKGAIIVHVTPLDAKEDVAGTKMVRAFEYVRDSLSDFGIKKAGWHWDGSAVWWLYVKNETLPKKMEWKGPPINLPDAVKKFKKKYPNAKKKGKHMVATIDRKYTTAKDAVRALLREKYVRERVAKVKL